MSSYDDMIHLDRPPSRYPKMKRQDRAKLFSPFDALSGYSAAVHRRDRVLVPQASLTDDAKSWLDQKLRRLERGDTVTAVWFAAEQQCAGERLGQYITAAGTVKKVDALAQKLYLDGWEIAFSDIAELRGGRLEEPDMDGQWREE